MIRITLIIALFFASLLNAQTSYEKDMQSSLKLFNDGNLTESIIGFEKIAQVEKDNWLPNYYIALIETQQAFASINDKNKMKISLEKAQKFQDIINRLQHENPEVLVLQAMIHTAWIVYDPMENGQKLYQDVLFLYSKAEKMAPNNPRVVYNKALFDKGMAEYFGQVTQPMCEQIKIAIELFGNFKPETPFYPTWGLTQAKDELEKCK